VLAGESAGANLITSLALMVIAFANLVPSRWTDGYPVEARANARSPLAP
jgi:acetyl esterase/lipase